MMVDRRQEVAGTTTSFDGIFAPFVGRADDSAGFETTSSPEVGESSGPMISSGLLGSSRSAGIPGTGAGGMFDFRRSTEFTGDDYEDPLVETTFVDILDQGGDGLIVCIGTEAHGIEDVVIDGVIIPVADTATEGPIQAGGEDFDSGLYQTTGEQELLSPGIATVSIARGGIFLREIERGLGLRIGEESHRLHFEFIKGGEFPARVELTFDGIEFLTER